MSPADLRLLLVDALDRDDAAQRQGIDLLTEGDTDLSVYVADADAEFRLTIERTN